MNDMTSVQQKYLREAFKVMTSHFHYFDSSAVSRNLKMTSLEAEDTLRALRLLGYVDTSGRPVKLIECMKADDDESYQRVAESLYVNGRAVEDIALDSANLLSSDGREAARQLIYEHRKAERDRWLGIAKLLWPIVAAVIVTWINNQISAPKPVPDAPLPNNEVRK